MFTVVTAFRGSILQSLALLFWVSGKVYCHVSKGCSPHERQEGELAAWAMD